jgi:LmbE family N-acetylglucosaminyl deacetylase
MKKILSIVAHPDDEALGLGGTLIKHSNQGDEVNIFIFSDGEGSKKSNEDRTLERLTAARKWSKEIKAKIFKIADFPDQKIDTIPQIDLVSEIEEALKIIKPDIVYIHNPTDINKDHEIVSKASLVALRPMRFLNSLPEIRAFETPSSTDQTPNLDAIIFKPNLYVSISKEWKKKIKALEIYYSELGSFPHPRSINSLEALAIKRGAESGLEMAEAFMIIKKIIK